ncbi:alpha/beta hydrolase [Flavobacterium silvaticum]|uniref:Alpha/beta hydrolase n=1 Tax=Flavobacterium silvaticum TaxID=1852020 RepID=A0A972FMS8_9FLAO|nr:alpha/beta hydrolase [Flavobacterium silvaticum]NMH28105.1 alpha/beta hydrolase [Flavobacterium silvaticum]
MKKIPVYFMPGMAASPDIFEHIKLPDEVFETHLLHWEMPIGNEPLTDYARRIAAKIKHENPILIGVSFGGIIVQEMATFLNPQKVVIISSVKSNTEFPRRMKMAKMTKLYKIFPTGMAENFDKFKSLPFSDKVKERFTLYEKFFDRREKEYLDWALEKILLWDRSEPDPHIVHIHGDADEVFPCKYIKDFIPVPGGTHIMIINKFRWLNARLPKILLGENEADANS